MKACSIQDAADWLEANDNYMVLTHKRPDGDTLGSASALVQGLRKLGKTAYLLPNTGVTPRYAPYVQDFWTSNGFTPSFVISIDTATTDLLPENASLYLDKISLCIDHHDSNTMYAERICCHPVYAACGEIVCDILERMFRKKDIRMNDKIANCLYVAISTDTGCFSYSNTTANTHKVAAFLIESGASNKEINKLLFRSKKRARIKIDGMVNAGMEFYRNGKVSIAVITREMMNASGASEDDIEDISNVAGSVEGVVIGITIREMASPTNCRVSVRTVPPYNANELCRKLGGGGHKTAAGATMMQSVDKVRSVLLAILDSYVF